MTLHERTQYVTFVLFNSDVPMTAREIATKYMGPAVPTTSDVLTTGTICNVLAAAGHIIKSFKPRTANSYFVTYAWTRFSETVTEDPNV
jgi:hypothetical protein